MKPTAQTTDQTHGDQRGVDLGRFDPYSDTHMFQRMDAYDRLHERGASFRSEAYEGFWILTRGEAMREALQNPTLFSSTATVPSDPNPDYQWLPLMLDPPLHTKWRQLIGPSFSPGAIERLKPRMRARVVELIDGLVDGGRCDFVKDFAREYPTRVFMELMGLPTDRLEQFMEWEDRIVNYSSESDPDRSKMYQAMADVRSFFKDLLDARREAPADDLVSAALTWELDGGPIPEDDLLNFCLLMFMAGLDTVTQQLAYIFGHLAGNPADRRAIATDPAVIPSAVEELLRYYGIVTVGRRVMEDTTFQGCPMKAGEIVFMPLTYATRDDRQFDDAGVVRIDREVNRHAAFGLGPHRCLGSHLARAELVIALEEWHRRIPDYRLDGIEPHEITEHSGGGVLGVDRLPLTWS